MMSLENCDSIWIGWGELKAVDLLDLARRALKAARVVATSA